MKAAVLIAPNEVVIDELPSPEAGPGELLIRVHSCGVCTATDLHLIDGHISRPLPFDGVTGLFGHESSGVVEEVGPGVSDFAPGDRVSFLGSGYQEFSAASADLCVHVPDGVPLERAIAEPLAVVLNSIDHAALRGGETVAVLGVGFMGLLILQALQHGPRCTVLVSDLVGRRLALARKFGAEIAIDAKDEDVVERLLGASSGRGVDVVIEAAGSPATLAQCGEVTGPEGTIILHGYFPRPVTIDLDPWHVKELTVINSHPATEKKYHRLMCEGLEWLAAGRFHLEDLITHEIDLDAFPDHIPLLRRPGEMIKTIVRTRGESR